MKVYPHLNFGGNCEEAFRFYEKELGGTITMMMKQGDIPDGVQRMNAANKVAHVRLSLGDVELIGNDVPEEKFEPIRSVYLYLSLDSTEEAERVYAALSAGGQVYMPMAETFYATRFGILRDKFGVLWTVIHEKARG